MPNYLISKNGIKYHIEGKIATAAENKIRKYLLIGLAGLVAILVLNSPNATVMPAVIVVLYFLPTIIARRRGHPDASSIFTYNLLTGWTVLGWAFSLFRAVN